MTCNFRIAGEFAFFFLFFFFLFNDNIVLLLLTYRYLNSNISGDFRVDSLTFEGVWFDFPNI